MGFVLSPATQRAGITTETWVCIDALAMFFIAAQPSLRRMTESSQIAVWFGCRPSDATIPTIRTPDMIICLTEGGAQPLSFVIDPARRFASAKVR